MNWYYTDGTNTIGPFNINNIKAIIQAGVINENTYVFTDGMENWVLAGETELFHSTQQSPQIPVSQDIGISDLDNLEETTIDLEIPKNPEKITLSALSCKNCDAELLLNDNSSVTICNFCGTPFEVQNQMSQTQSKTTDVCDVVPFSVTQEQFHRRALEWLSEGDYTPDDILLKSEFKNVRGLYAPVLCVCGDFDVDWTASAGYNREEQYTEYCMPFGKSEKEWVTKTKTVTDWRPAQGHFKDDYIILYSLATEISLMQGKGENFLTSAFNNRAALSRTIKMEASMLHDYITLNPTLDSELMQLRIRADLFLQAQTRAAEKVQGDRYKDLDVNISNNNSTLNILFVPLWLATYHYQNIPYQIYISGADDSLVGDSPKPIDKNRKKMIKDNKTKGGCGCAGFFILSFFLLLISVKVLDRHKDIPENTEVAIGMLIFFSMIIICVIGVLWFIHFLNKNSRLKEGSQKRRNRILENALSTDAKNTLSVSNTNKKPS